MKKIGIFLIVLGIAITSYPLLQQWYDQYQQNRMLDNMDFLNDDAADQLTNLGGVFDNLIDEQAGNEEVPLEEIVIEGLEDFTDSVDPTPVEETTSVGAPNQQITTQVESTTTSPKPVVKLKALGKIEIPSIDVKMPVVEGTGTEELRRSAGHLTGTDMPGEIGNSVLAGHRGYSYGRLFNRLDELVKGDKIIVTTKAGTFTYEVYETKIVEPTDLSVLNRNSKDRVLTLITCTPMFKSTHRIIIHAVMR